MLAGWRGYDIEEFHHYRGDSTVAVVGLLIRTGEYVRGRAMGVVRDGSAHQFARCLAKTPNKQGAASITVQRSLGEQTSHLERALGR